MGISWAIKLDWQTRPDVAYYACDLSVSIKDATFNDLIIVNKHMRKVKTENLPIKILGTKDFKHCHIICFSDASLI